MAFKGAWNLHKPNITVTHITKKIYPGSNVTSVMVENVNSVVRCGSDLVFAIYYLCDLGQVTLCLQASVSLCVKCNISDAHFIDTLPEDVVKEYV